MNQIPMKGYTMNDKNTTAAQTTQQEAQDNLSLEIVKAFAEETRKGWKQAHLQTPGRWKGRASEIADAAIIMVAAGLLKPTSPIVFEALDLSDAERDLVRAAGNEYDTTPEDGVEAGMEEASWIGPDTTLSAHAGEYFVHAGEYFVDHTPIPERIKKATEEITEMKVKETCGNRVYGMGNKNTDQIQWDADTGWSYTNSKEDAEEETEEITEMKVKEHYWSPNITINGLDIDKLRNNINGFDIGIKEASEPEVEEEDDLEAVEFSWNGVRYTTYSNGTVENEDGEIVEGPHPWEDQPEAFQTGVEVAKCYFGIEPKFVSHTVRYPESKAEEHTVRYPESKAEEDINDEEGDTFDNPPLVDDALGQAIEARIDRLLELRFTQDAEELLNKIELLREMKQNI